MHCLGIDLGSSSIKVALLDEQGLLLETREATHCGEPLEVLKKILAALFAQYAPQNIHHAAVSGTGPELLSALPLTQVDSIPAIHAGIMTLCPTAESVIEIGAQNARYLTNLHQGCMPGFAVNENCAGGTGSFFEDQVGRLNLEIDDYSRIVENATSIPRLSGRCSVFAKTDIIHHQQEGASSADILLGLCYAAIRNYKATIVRRLPVKPPVALCGGLSKNSGVIRAVQEIFKLDKGQLITGKDLNFVQAVGAAKEAAKSKALFDVALLQGFLQNPSKNLFAISSGTNRKKALSLIPGTILQDPEVSCPKSPFTCSLGIDVGSTSTNIVLMTEEGELADYLYLRTAGNPEKTVRDGLSSIGVRLGDLARVTAVGVTGSGRHMIGKLVGADTVVDEITAQAQGALRYHPEVDTVFEIGGQDSKYISINKGAVVDFQMNKICAAGTGSFIEEQAERMGIENCGEIGPLALSAKKPVDLGERCTVFMGSSVVSHLAAGADKNDILAGLCHATVDNYLHKVVGEKPVGNHIVLQGGVAWNAGIVAAFQERFHERLQVSPLFPVSGAVGAALLAAKASCGKTAFKGFDLSADGKAETDTMEKAAKANTAFYKKGHNLLLEGYDGKIDAAKKTVGIPRVLLIYKFFPLAHKFFKQLGFNVLISDETNADTIALSQLHAKTETCFPVKLIHGHMMELVEKGVDYIFLPRIHTMRHEASHVHHNYGCVYMQTAPPLVTQSLGLEERGITLLSPQFSLDFGKKAMGAAMMGVGKALGKNKLLCAKAMIAGAMAVRRHAALMEEQGQKLLESLKPDEKVLVLISRAYGLADPVLNMGVPKILLRHGYKLITLGHLPAHDLDISSDHPNMYWPFGQHIISGAKLVRNHPNLYAVYLTNHGCGPDTMLAHLFAEEMAGKPFLHLEVDEHFSEIGVETRIEAFLHSLESRPATNARVPVHLPPPEVKTTKIRTTPTKDAPLYLPPLWPYSELAAALLQSHGFDARLLPESSPESLTLGGKEAISKEYLSFTALLGAILQKAETAEKNAQFLVFHTEGAEADGLYSRCIRTVLDRKGYSGFPLVSPMLETLAENPEYFAEVFLALLTEDLIWAAPPEARRKFADRCIKAIGSKPQGIDDVLQLAREVASLNHRSNPNPSPGIALIGEPACTFDGLLNHHLFEEAKGRNFFLKRMPLSEFCWFLWASREKNGTAKENLEIAEKWMDQVSMILGNLSAFSANRPEMEAVYSRDLRLYAGANGGYRHAKCVQELAEGRPVIMANSMYENTGTIISMIPRENEGRLLELSLGDTTELVAKGRLLSFLHYQAG